MSSKYGNWTRGEDEALLNILGGVEIARDILRGKIKVVFQTVVSSIKFTRKLFVDEDKSVECLLRVAEFRRYDNRISSQNFPVKENSEYEEREIAIFHFDVNLSSDTVIKNMSDAGYRPATIWELVSLAMKEPYFYEDFAVVALGSVCTLDTQYTVSLYKSHGTSELGLAKFNSEGGWHATARFAAVKK